MLFHWQTMNKQGLVPIWVRITVDGKRAECSTQKQINPKFWDAEKNKVLDKHSEVRSINDHLTLVKADILRHCNIPLSINKAVSADCTDTCVQPGLSCLGIRTNSRHPSCPQFLFAGVKKWQSIRKKCPSETDLFPDFSMLVHSLICEIQEAS